MENPNFFAGHCHFQESDCRQLWADPVHPLNGHTQFGGNRTMATSNTGTLDTTSSSTLQPVPITGRRISVPAIPICQSRLLPDCSLSRSAPANLFPSHLANHPGSLANSIGGHSVFTDTKDDLTGHIDSSQSTFGRQASSFSNFGSTTTPPVDGCHHFISGFDTGPAGQAHFGRSPSQTWSQPDVSATCDQSGGYGTSVSDETSKPARLPMNTNAFGSPTTGELTTYSPLASSTFTSGMTRETSAMSSTNSMRGGVDVMNFESNFPISSSFSNFPQTDLCGELSLSFPLVSSNDSFMFPMESDHHSPSVSNQFSFMSEDTLSLPTSFPAQNFVVSCPQTGPAIVVEDFSLPQSGVDHLNASNDSHVPQWPRGTRVVRHSRRIAPKSKSDKAESPEALYPSRLDPVQAQDGKRKFAISKAPYVRQKNPKKMCDQCDEHREGFRSDYELRRHIDRAHSNVRKMWVCIEKDKDGKFLANCKKCRNGKRYGAYYNAAAHLRRAHFNKRERGQSKSTERRGGMGGGDKPPMEELKHWMREIEVDALPNMNKSESPSSDGEGDSDSDDMPSIIEEGTGDSYNIDDSPRMALINSRRTTSAMEYSSYSVKRPRNAYHTIETEADNSSFFVGGQYHTDANPPRNNGGRSYSFSASDMNHRSAFSCSFQASDVHSPICGPSFNENYFPLKQ